MSLLEFRGAMRDTSNGLSFYTEFYSEQEQSHCLKCEYVFNNENDEKSQFLPNIYKYV